MADHDLTPAMEDYLEAIYCIGLGQRIVRVKNIASRIGVKMPTVISMLKSLNQKGFVEYEKHEYLELTPKGEEVGKEINRRHQALLTFLINILGIDPVLANEEACRIEHGVSAETMVRLQHFIDFIDRSAQASPGFLQSFNEYQSGKLHLDKSADTPDAGINKKNSKVEPSSGRKDDARDPQ